MNANAVELVQGSDDFSEKPMTQLTLCLLFVLAIVFPHASKAKAPRCTVIYSLTGISHQSLNTQIDRLSASIEKHNIRIIDMNTWQDTPPHFAVTGRQKRLMRKQYVMSKFKNTAVLLDSNENVISRYENTVDLVDLLLSCKRHQTGEAKP